MTWQDDVRHGHFQSCCPKCEKEGLGSRFIWADLHMASNHNGDCPFCGKHVINERMKLVCGEISHVHSETIRHIETCEKWLNYLAELRLVT